MKGYTGDWPLSIKLTLICKVWGIAAKFTNDSSSNISVKSYQFFPVSFCELCNKKWNHSYVVKIKKAFYNMA